MTYAKLYPVIYLSPETEALAARLAAMQSLPIDDTIREALEARARGAGLWQRDSSVAAIAARKASINRIVATIASLPVLDARSPGEIMDDLNAL